MSEVALMNPNGQRHCVSFLIVAVGLTVLMISGCMVGPNYHPPQLTAPSCMGRVGGDADWPTVRGHCAASRTHTVVAPVQRPDIDRTGRGSGEGKPRS